MGMFVGYDEHRRVYRILPEGSSHYVVARAVIFDERMIIQKMLARCTKTHQHVHDIDSDGGDTTPIPQHAAT